MYGGCKKLVSFKGKKMKSNLIFTLERGSWKFEKFEPQKYEFVGPRNTYFRKEDVSFMKY